MGDRTPAEFLALKALATEAHYFSSMTSAAKPSARSRWSASIASSSDPRHSKPDERFC